jgi:cell division protein FtsQ
MSQTRIKFSTHSYKGRAGFPVKTAGRTRKILFAAAIALIICSGGAGLTAWTRTAPLFQLANIDVDGNRALSSQRALEMVPVEKGTNIFAVDLDAIETAIKSDPRVEEVSIRRLLPSTIIITIREREPIMFVSGAELHGLDEQGLVIPLERGEEFQDVPVLTGILPQVQPGQGSDLLGIQSALAIREAILQLAPSLWDKISEINMAQPEAPMLYLVGDGAQVRLSSGDLRTQIQRLWVVLSDLAAHSMTAKNLDLRFKDQLVCQPATQAGDEREWEHEQ